jgi:hypothetical protein
MYNRVVRRLAVLEETAHNYNVNTVRAWNNNQALSDYEYFIGLQEDAIFVGLTSQISVISTDGNPRVSVAVNSTTVEYGGYGIALIGGVASHRARGGSALAIMPSLGYSFVCAVEASSAGTAPGATFAYILLEGIIQA